jgi:cytochrome c biogenesis protein CcmG, thiol:disulfide interchange protein DsbE
MVLKSLVALVALALSASGTALAQDVGLPEGTQAPAAKVETLDGRPADLSSIVGKAPVVMEFWASWCGNCKQLESHLRAMHAKYGRQVRFVGIAVSINQSPARAKAYVERHKLPGTWFYDRTGAASGAYEAPATSYVVVIDRSGKVVYTGVGGTQQLESAIRKALAPRPNAS